MLRCAQSPRSNVLVKYASARRFFARLASQIFLSSLQTRLQPFFVKRRLRKPPVHFLLIGLALFVVYYIVNPVSGDRYQSNRIELTPDDLRQMTIEWLAGRKRCPVIWSDRWARSGRFRGWRFCWE